MSDHLHMGQWEKRWHPLRNEWIVYAAHRNSRPWNFAAKENKSGETVYDPDCYLCPRNTRVSGKVNPDYKDIFIFDNDHPVVGVNAPAIPEEQLYRHEGLYKKQKAGGIARVVCYDPRHNVTLSDVSVSQVHKVFIALREQMKFFESNQSIRSVLIFENKGEVVGVSNPHPHCQIYATDFVFKVFEKELQAMDDYTRDHSKNIFEEIILAEKKDGSRIIAENEQALAFIPFFARFAYETYIFPRKRHATLITMNDDELKGLAELFQIVTKKFDLNFRMSFPYILIFAQSPVDGNNYEGYHTHLIISPPLRQPGILKYLAGPETGADTFMADTIPEEKAAELRNIVV